jgi:hypothetical protein
MLRMICGLAAVQVAPNLLIRFSYFSDVDESKAHDASETRPCSSKLEYVAHLYCPALCT